jgi:hypothetical protein
VPHRRGKWVVKGSVTAHSGRRSLSHGDGGGSVFFCCEEEGERKELTSILKTPSLLNGIEERYI